VRFGVSIFRADSAADWRDKGKKAEDLGFSTLLTADHLGPMTPPLLPLVAVAAATDRLRVGTFVINNDFHHPVFLAHQAAALGVLSDGRFELGIGAGHMRSEYDVAGLPFDGDGVRVDRLAESVAIVTGLLAGEEVTHLGDHYTVRGARLESPPDPRPPLLVGGNGRRVLEIGARHAQIVGLAGLIHRRGGSEVDLRSFTWRGAQDRVAIVREAAGSRPIEINVLVQAVVSDVDSLRPHLGGLADADAVRSPYLLVGSTEAMVEALLERQERLGIGYVVVFERFMDAVAPVVARLAE
jgi:probable F420-dependent oxidoreductase